MSNTNMDSPSSIPSPFASIAIEQQFTDDRGYHKDTVVSAIVEQFIDRSRLGMAKYGTTLDRDDLDIIDWIEHSKQEAMDFVLYLERLKRECQRRFPQPK